jgi:hypothetical protein
MLFGLVTGGRTMTAKDNKRKRHINERMRTSFTSHGSRAAGMGILHDDYSEESGRPRYDRSAYPVYTTDWLEEKEKERLPGPVITKRLEDCHDSKICRALLRERQKLM